MNAIEFENVGKQYRLGLVSTDTFSHDLNRWWTMNVLRRDDPYLKIGDTNDRAHKGESDYVWALKDINFSVEEGDVVGIIGKMQDVSKGEGRIVLFVSHNMAAVKKLCKRGILLENGEVKYIGGVEDTIRMYIDDGTIPAQSVFFEDLSTAPGNDKVRIKSFEVLPVNGDVVNVASGIHFRLKFMNYVPNILLDAAF